MSRQARHTRPRPARAFVVWLIAMGAVASLTAQPPPRGELLNSERIEQTFGSYGIEVLASDGRLRVSNLYSGEGIQRVCRTLALVRYPAAADPVLAEEHAAIAAGGSIGATFAAAGWTVGKRNLYFGEIDPSPRLRALMGGIAAQPLAVHIYSLEVAKDGVQHEYAAIAELHHPDYLRLEDLHAIYGDLPDGAAVADAAVTELLNLARAAP